MRKEFYDDIIGDVAVEEAEPTVAQPPRYRVFLYNDDYTPMEFVVEVLQGFFNLTHEQAVIKMLEVHNTGKAYCGSFSRDIADTKVTRVNNYARKYNYPLLCDLEKE